MIKLKFRKTIAKLIKEDNFISLLYVFLLDTFIKLLEVFYRKPQKQVLFVSFGGKQISDSPKRIYQIMKNDPYFKDYNFVWAVLDKKKRSSLENDSRCKLVKIDSVSYYIMCLKSNIWVTNSGIKRYTNLSSKKTLFVNTWHGVPMKKIGVDEVSVKKSKIFAKKWFEFAEADINLACSEYDKKILMHVFRAPEKSFFSLGLPRNDKLYEEKKDKASIREALKIGAEKKVILYAPTVRGENGPSFHVPLNLKKWQYALPNYIILFRAHYFITNIDLKTFPNVIDVTHYDELDELMEISDVLITDYSSLAFDFSILEKPIYSFAYDLKDYAKYQGLYIDIQQELPNCIENEDDLIKAIFRMNLSEEKDKTRKFREKYMKNSTGEAGQRTVRLIKNKMEMSQE